MSEEKSLLAENIEILQQHRDEIALQVHLGTMEAKDEFENAKEKLEGLTREFNPIRDAVEESASNVIEGLKLTAEELLASFGRIRKSLK
jgi:SMC interacting uncharacterized protein involved in chromosome segregation